MSGAANRADAESCTGSRWELAPLSDEAAQRFTEEFGTPRFIATILACRSIRSVIAAQAFFAPALEQLHDPYLLCGMPTAVERILAAIRHQESILIYGDYDVDGTLATVLLKTAIDRITPKSIPSLVRYHIPHRIREGYGVQASVLGQAADSGVRLVVSVDTGIRAFAAAEEAKLLGLDLIVTDHHLPQAAGVPDAVAVINPNQQACSYPEKNLCGAAVAYKLADALLRSAMHDDQGLHAVEPAGLRRLQCSLLKLAAIATIADAVPLTGENRTIVSLGLHELREVRQPGLLELMRLSQTGQHGTAPTASEIAFRIAPRINAAGRMDLASDVVRLLLTRDLSEAHELAHKLNELNEERRAVEATVLQEIHLQVAALHHETQPVLPNCYVVDGAEWHRGVVGILASRVVDRTNRPALVVTHDSTGDAHGSGRSVSGFHLLDAIETIDAEHLRANAKHLFHRFGGHAHAIGFSLPSAHVPLLRKHLQEYAEAFRDSLGRQKTLSLDAELPLAQAGKQAWEWLQRLQPFGNGNTEPVLLARQVRLLEVVPLKERHLKLRLWCNAEREITCVCWSRAYSWPARLAEMGIVVGDWIDLAYQLRWNFHPVYGGCDIQVCDLRRADIPAG